MHKMWHDGAEQLDLGLSVNHHIRENETMKPRLAIAVVLAVFMPAWGWELMKFPDSLMPLLGFIGYVTLIGYLIATGYRPELPKR
jgi:hypothetical protein